MQENKSEVARLMQQIERECEAMKRLLEAPAVVASHTVINARYTRLDNHREQLASIVGEDEALQLLHGVYTKTVG